MKKLKYEFVKSIFEKEKYILISKEYINSRTKMETICPNGHQYFVNINALKDNGDRCSECAGTKKYNFDYVKNIIESKGYKLISTEYRSSKHKLRTICPKGHPYDMTFGNFLNKNHGCSICSGLYRYNIENVIGIFKKEGYQLLSQEYINSSLKMETICPNNHRYSVSLNSFLSESRCLECSGLKKYSLDEVKDIFNKRHETLLSEEYTGNKQKLSVLCRNGHTYSIKLNTVLSMGIGCAYCSGNKKKTIEEVASILLKEGYSLLSTEYRNNQDKIRAQCPIGHVYEFRLHDFIGKHKSRCISCWLVKYSKLEIELLKWVKNYFPNAAKGRLPYTKNGRNRTLEVDIFIPEIGIAIEFNGLYWHSDKFKDRLNSFEKMQRANKAGIRLITIFEDEWIYSQENTKNRLIQIFTKKEKENLKTKLECLIKENGPKIEIISDNRWEDSNTYLDLDLIPIEDIEIKGYYIKGQKRYEILKKEKLPLIFDCGYKKWSFVPQS